MGATQLRLECLKLAESKNSIVDVVMLIDKADTLYEYLVFGKQKPKKFTPESPEDIPKAEQKSIKECLKEEPIKKRVPCDPIQDSAAEVAQLCCSSIQQNDKWLDDSNLIEIHTPVFKCSRKDGRSRPLNKANGNIIPFYADISTANTQILDQEQIQSIYLEEMAKKDGVNPLTENVKKCVKKGNVKKKRINKKRNETVNI